MKFVFFVFTLLALFNYSSQTAEEDTTLCNKDIALVVVEKTTCKNVSEQLGDKTYKCCWVQTTENAQNAQGCRRIKDTAEDIQKEIDKAKTDGVTLEIDCTTTTSSSFLLPSMIIAITFLLL